MLFMASQIKGVLFDLDGTLIDTYELILSSFRHATREVLGRNIPDGVLMQKVGQPLTVQMWDFTDDQETHDTLLTTYRAHNESVHDDVVSAFPGVAETVRELRAAGMRLGVVTSKRHALAQRALDLLGLSECFEFLIGSDDCSEHKPSPAPVLRGCELLGLEPSACVYVGDSPFDIQAGNAAGCTTAAALWGMFSERDLMAASPDLKAERINELPALLK